MNVTKQEADELIAERKIVSGNITWQRLGRNYRMSEVVVLALESNKILRLTGFVGSHRSFALLYRNQPIRKWMVHHHHQNPDGQIVYGPHKHTWDEAAEYEWAYVPTDVRVGDPNQELRDFLQECNIEVIGAIQTFMF